MTWISVKDKLPPDRTYVLAHHVLTNWHDKDGQYEIHCVVVKFTRGISVEERDEMRAGRRPNPVIQGTKRSEWYYPEDEWGNNKLPYCWHEFGPAKFFGQEVDYWMPLPQPPP